MNLFINAFHLILYKPLFNVLILLYEYLPGHDFGVAVILLTILLKLILYPLTSKGIKSQKALQELQPEIKAIQEKFKNDKEKQLKESMELYKKAGVNPFSGFLVLLIQLPILFALFRVFLRGFGKEQLKFLYGFISFPGEINTTFLGIINLTKASAVLAVITGIFQFFQMKTLTISQQVGAGQALKEGTPDFSQMMQKQTLYFFPIITVFFLWKLPAAIALYWLATTLFTICQQCIIIKKNKK